MFVLSMTQYLEILTFGYSWASSPSTITVDAPINLLRRFGFSSSHFVCLGLNVCSLSLAGYTPGYTPTGIGCIVISLKVKVFLSFWTVSLYSGMHVKFRNLQQKKMHQGASDSRNKMRIVMLFVTVDVGPFIS